MACEVIGPGLIPGDVKVRCSFCQRTKMLRRAASGALMRERARAKGEEAGDE